mmetsp:Transcript_58053/g.136044  ORF Transcript_58053/g.136044 Transcript_58053/m.136044 type:complete len:247 (-) Transcript_58053:106-846(-)
MLVPRAVSSMARILTALALLVLQADAKGGYSGGGYSGGGYSGGYSYSGGYYSSGSMVTNRAAFATAGAFGAVILLSDSRRRYGVYHDPADSSQCLLATEDEMRNACANVMQNETSCHDCIACESESCMYRYSGCDEFLATIFIECCTEDCDGGEAVIGAIMGIGITAVICMCGCCIAFNIMKKANSSSVHEVPGGGGSPVPYGTPGYGGGQAAYNPNPVYGGAYVAGPAQGQVVQGQVVGMSPGKA